MEILILCIVINSLIGIIFKLFGKYEVEVLPAIVVNYFTCVICGCIYAGEWMWGTGTYAEPWFPYAAFLGIVFVSIFTVVAKTVQVYGIMVATIFQKMSLLAPSIIGILYYSESSSIGRIAGIILALVSIVLISFPKDRKSFSWAFFYLPMLTWIGSCVIEAVLYYVNVEGISGDQNVDFVTTIFFMAGIFGSLYLAANALFSTTKTTIRKKEIGAGILLGIPNFFSIYLILLLLEKGWEGSLVFPVNNVGVLTLSSLVGIIVFSEEISKLKISGFIAAIVSILLISFI